MVKGYKAFNKNLKCRDIQYQVGKTYELEEYPVLCDKGFHFCKNIADIFVYYSFNCNTRVYEIIAHGK